MVMRKSLIAMLVLSVVFVAGFAGGGASLETVPIEGVVTYDGRLPDPIPVSEAGTSRQLIEVDPKTKGLKDAVVWLEGVPEPRAHQEVADKPVVMDQQNFFFVPHVLAVKSGQVVEFRNSDVANHGVRASSLEPGNQFNVMIPFGESLHPPIRRPRSTQLPSAARSIQRWQPGSSSSTTATMR